MCIRAVIIVGRPHQFTYLGISMHAQPVSKILLLGVQAGAQIGMGIAMAVATLAGMPGLQVSPYLPPLVVSLIAPHMADIKLCGHSLLLSLSLLTLD